jgi:hypothetical protein
MESQLKGWISLIGGIGFILAGVISLEPILVGLGIVVTLISWGTFWLRNKTKDRYKTRRSE